MSFSQHGTYQIKRQGNIIIVDAKGPYNDELMQAYRADYKQAMDAVSAEFPAWSQVTFMHEDSIMTPEAEQALLELNIVKASKGFKRSAIIFVDAKGQLIVEAQFVRIYKKAEVAGRHAFSAWFIEDLL